MAKKVRNEIAVGITTLVVLALTIYIVAALADWSTVFRKTNRITVQLPYQEGLHGLMAASPIYLGGVKIGKISQIQIQTAKIGEAEAADIFVSFTMDIPRQYLLRQDCVLAPESNVLGGQAQLNIKDLGSKGEIIKDGQTVTQIKFEPGITDAIKQEFNSANPDSLISHLKYEVNRQNPDSIVASLAYTAANLKDITAKLNQQLTPDEEKQTLIAKVHNVLDRLAVISENINNQLDTDNQGAILTKIDTALDKLNSSLGEVEELVKTNKPDITQTISSLKNTAGQLEKDLPQITGRITAALDKADKAIDLTKEALENLKVFSTTAKDTLLVNREKIDKILSDVGEVSSNLKLTSRDVRRAPWKLLYKPKKDELKIQGLIDSAGDFAAGAERLDNAAVQLRTIIAKSASGISIDQKDLKNMMAELESSFEGFQQVQQKFWDELKINNK